MQASQFTVDSITVSIPLLMVNDNPNNYIPSTQGGDDDITYDDLKVGVISDLHMADYETGVDTHLVTMLNKFKSSNVDVILIPGDIINTGLASQYDKFNNIWNSVFTDPSTAPQRLAITGNHEFEQAYYERETIEDVYNKYKQAHGYDTVNFNVNVKGYHFIGINSEGPAVHGKYTDITADWLRDQLDDAVAENPNQPIFVTAHQSLSGTSYGSDRGHNTTSAIKAVLQNYPQVIFFAGHSHYPIENERNIYQNKFTCIDVTSLQYVKDETGKIRDYDAQGGLEFSVEGINKQIVVDRYRIDGNSVRKVKDSWTLKLPLRTNTFDYTDARKDSRDAPIFAPDSTLTVSNITTESLKLDFPSATHDDFVQGYNVYIKEKGSSDIVLSTYFTSDFYLDLSNMATKQSTIINISSLLPNLEYVVEVTAGESFGLESDPLTQDFSTLPVTYPSDAVNRADFLDVNFVAQSFKDNSPYRLAYKLYGSDNQSKLEYSDELKSNVLSANGWINYSVTKGMLSKINDSVTMEIAFMVPGNLPTDQCLFGNFEEGGASIEFSNDGVLCVRMNVEGSIKTVDIPNINPNTWYHIIVVFDGSTIQVYVNGENVANTTAVGTINNNPNLLYYTIGGDVDTTGNAINPYIGKIAVARVYTNAMTTSQVNQSYSFFKNNAMYQSIYEKLLILKTIDIEEIDPEYEDDVLSLISQAQNLITSSSLSQTQTDDYLSTANSLLDNISKTDPSINWRSFQDPCSDFSLIFNKSPNWQNDKNERIQKQFFTKNQNTDENLIYKVDGYIRSIKIAALVYAGFGDVERDIDVYLSKDGIAWDQLILKSSEPVNDPAYESGDPVSWKNSTVSTENYIGEDYTYLKLVVKKFENGITWSIGIDDVIIRTSDNKVDVPLLPDTFVNQINPDPTGTPTPTETPEFTITLTGKLVDKLGNPIKNRKIEIQSDPITTITNESGEYTFYNVPLGNHTLIVYETDGVTVAASLNITIKKGSVDSVDGNIITVKGVNVIITSMLDGNELIIKTVETSPQTSDSVIHIYLLFLILTGSITLIYRRKKSYK